MSTQPLQGEHDQFVPNKDTASAPTEEDAKYDSTKDINRPNPTRSVLSPTPISDKTLDQPSKVLDQPPLDRPPSVIRLDSSKINLPNGNTTQITDVCTTNPNPQQQNPTQLSEQATAAVTALSSLYGLYNQYKASQSTPTPNASVPTPQNPAHTEGLVNQALSAYNSVKNLMSSGVTHINTTTTVTNPDSTAQQDQPDNEIVRNVQTQTTPQGPQQQSQSIDLQGVMTMLGGLLNTNNASATDSTSQSHQQPTNANLANVMSLISAVGPLLASAASRSNQHPPSADNTNLTTTTATTTATAPHGNINNTDTHPQSGNANNTNFLSTLGSIASAILAQNAATNPSDPQHQQQQQQQQQPNISPEITGTLHNLSCGFQGLAQLSKMFGK